MAKMILEAKIPPKYILSHLGEQSSWLADQLSGAKPLNERLENYVKRHHAEWKRNTQS